VNTEIQIQKLLTKLYRLVFFFIKCMMIVWCVCVCISSYSDHFKVNEREPYIKYCFPDPETRCNMITGEMFHDPKPKHYGPY
jgi:hypothetical protein